MSAAPMRVLIVDDEPLARQRISDLLVDRDGIKIVGEADSGRAAVEAIQRSKPDLVFLDVQMPGMTGLDVVRAVGVEAMPTTIFVTAYDQYALQAFELAAVDYLVKPFDDDRFEQALQRARRVTAAGEAGRLRDRLLAVLNEEVPRRAPELAEEATQGVDRIRVESRGKVKFIPVSEIDYVTSSGPYAELVVGTRRYLIREAMQSLEERLDPAQFFRVHRSAIVRLDRVDTLIKGAGGDYSIQLKDGTKLKVSRSRRELLEQRLAGTGRADPSLRS
ncbi:MAG TPA: LytTR family DNA-binding domain-containing protein [Gemmatimonadaceae bacterium]